MVTAKVTAAAEGEGEALLMEEVQLEEALLPRKKEEVGAPAQLAVAVAVLMRSPSSYYYYYYHSYQMAVGEEGVHPHGSYLYKLHTAAGTVVLIDVACIASDSSGRTHHHNHRQSDVVGAVASSS